MTPQPARWPQRFIIGLLILFTAAGLWMNHASAPVAQAAPTQNAFGPTLFLVSAPPERADELFALAHPHARLSGDQPRFIASGSPDDLVKLADAGFAVQLLDQRTAGQVYYFVDLQEANAADDREAKSTSLATMGRVLWADKVEALIAMESHQERAFVDAAAAQDLHLSLLAPDFLAPMAAYDPARSPTRSAVLQTNPFVTTLLDQVSSTQISTLIGDLSGVRPVNIYGTAITLNSRYTFATRIRDAERYLYQFYEQRGMAVRYDDWTYGSYSGRNIIAEIPGTTHPERIWLVGGHFDSISQDPYNSAPGADDNGSGTAATLVIADILRNVQFGDTVRFVHFSGEEQGQWGSKSYARSLALAGAQVMGYIDLDMIGWDGNGDRVMEIHTGTGQGSNDLGTLFMSANAAYNQQLVIERKSTSASRFSDHSPFWDNGFPAFLAIENFFVDAIPNDRNPWYHNTGDTLSRVDLSYVVRHAKVALAVLAEQAGAFTGPTPTPTVPPTATPTSQPTNTPTPTATPQPGCTELILNGGFETADGWSFGPTPLQAGTVTSPVLAGSRALRMGTADSASTAYSHSSAYQRVHHPRRGDQCFSQLLAAPRPQRGRHRLSGDPAAQRQPQLPAHPGTVHRAGDGSMAGPPVRPDGRAGQDGCGLFQRLQQRQRPGHGELCGPGFVGGVRGRHGHADGHGDLPGHGHMDADTVRHPFAPHRHAVRIRQPHRPRPRLPPRTHRRIPRRPRRPPNQPINQSTRPPPRTRIRQRAIPVPRRRPRFTPTLAATATPTVTPTAYPEPVGRVFLPSIFARWFGSNEGTATPMPTHTSTPTRTVGATATAVPSPTPTPTPTSRRRQPRPPRRRRTRPAKS